MQDQQIIKLIENLKGRRNYEEKKAVKLGFTSLYAYFENSTQISCISCIICISYKKIPIISLPAL